MPAKLNATRNQPKAVDQTIANLRLPPQNNEAEQAVLGAILIDQDCLVKIIELINPTSFYQQNHQTIFQIMLQLFEKRKPIDVLTVSDELERDKKLDDIGGLSYLTTLANTTISSANVVTYAEIVKNNSILRQLIHAGSEIANLGFKTAEDTNLLLDQAEQLVFTVSQQFLAQTFVPIKDILAETFERIELLHSEKGRLRGVSTGFAELDHITSGLQKSDLIIIAARPSMGKSSLALNIALQAAVKEKLTVGIFSLEMGKDQVIDRLIIAESAIDSWRYRTGNFEDDDFEKISHAFGILGDAAIFVDDSAMLNAMELRAKARRLQAEHGLGVLVVDYLQLMEGQRRSVDVNRVQEISEISRSLKGIARELNVPVIALSQLSRAVEHRSPPIPQLADLRESGSLEQDADLVMFIYREDYYKPDSERKNIADILIKKHRNGPTGEIELYFAPEHMRFRSIERKRGWQT